MVVAATWASLMPPSGSAGLLSQSGPLIRKSPDPWSGGGVEGHGVAQRLELADVLSDLAFGIGSGGVVVRPEVDEVGVIVGEQRPDDDEDRSADRHDRAVLAAAAGDAPVALTQEGVGAGRADRGLPENAGQVAVAVTGAGVALLPAGGLADSGGEPGPGGQVRRSREPRHVQTDLGQDRLGRRGADAGNLIESGHRPGERGDLDV